MSLVAAAAVLSTRISRRGPYHRIMRAVYEERKYKYCVTGQSFSNCEHVAKYWEPHVWAGGLNLRMKPRVPDHVTFDRYYAKRLHRGEIFTASRQENQTFGEGLTLLAYSLKSQTGYSEATALRWKGLTGCRRRWLYGHEKHPTVAGAVYARSRGCR